jgi:hypothetical protein
VYGSTEKDEYLCSCGWRGTTLQLREHYETAAKESGRRIEAFVRLLDEHSVTDSWDHVASLEADPAYLSPGELRCALANRRYVESSSDVS